PELRERLIGALGILAGDALAAADVLDPREQHLARDRVEREQQMLGRDVVVLELPRLLEGLVEHARERGAGGGLLRGALDRRLRGERGLGLRAQSGRIRDEL